jgi:ATP-binding cassette, subfamily C (CFTR/MRP), member 1
MAQVLVSAISQFRMRHLSLRAADSLHSSMLTSLLSAPMSFFHTNPSGRVTNRLTKDTSDIDRNLAFYATMWFQAVLQLISTAVVVGAVTPFVLPILVPLLLLFGMLYLYFQASVREVKRLDSLARSPIFTAVSNAMSVRSLRPFILHCLSGIQMFYHSSLATLVHLDEIVVNLTVAIPSDDVSPFQRTE